MSKGILLLDNNDSFTFNVVELIRSINGFEPIVMKSSRINLEDVKQFDKIIISPGPGLPKDFKIINKIINKFAGEKSILGICLGHQAICEYYGANLVNMSNVVHGQAKEISHNFNSKLFNNIPLKFNVGLYHSWFVNDFNFPDELFITSTSQDGLIMSIEHKKHKIYGVQFHPESFITEHGKQLMMNFLEI